MAGQIGYGRDIPLAREGGPGTPQGGGKVSGLSPQQAVKILSLRVPERPSPTGIAPLPLLQSPGGLGANAQGLDAMLQGLMAAFPQLPNQGGSGLGRGPNPQVPSFGGPGTPDARQGVELPGLIPPSAPAPPRITPAPSPTEPETPLASDDMTPGFQTDITPLPIAQPPRALNPFDRPGRNPRLAEKAGFEPYSGFGADSQSLF